MDPIRDIETEALRRTAANPLFRAASRDSGLVRTILVRDRAINGFRSTGNRMFISRPTRMELTGSRRGSRHGPIPKPHGAVRPGGSGKSGLGSGRHGGR